MKVFQNAFVAIAISLVTLTSFGASAGTVDEECPVDLLDQITTDANRLEEIVQSRRRDLKSQKLPPKEVRAINKELKEFEALIIEARAQVTMCRNFNDLNDVKVLSDLRPHTPPHEKSPAADTRGFFYLFILKWRFL